MKTLVVDTNVVLRFFLNDVPHQKQEVDDLLGKAKSGSIRLIIMQINIFELHFALSKYYQFDKSSVIDVLKSLIATDYIEIESREAFGLALELYNSYNIEFVDSFLLASLQMQNAELFTFDKKLKKVERR